jgi:hypothetical protein
MTTLWIIIAVAVAVAAIIIYMTTRKNAEETQQVINQPQPQAHQIVGSSSKLKSIDSGTWYMCIKDIMPYVAGVVYLGADIDPKINMWERYFREATKEEIEEQHPTPEPEPAPEPTPEPEEKVDYTVLNDVLDKFTSTINIAKDSQTYYYLSKLYDEVYWQYYKPERCTLPLLYSRINFPIVYDYWGENTDEDAAFKTMVGWMVALHLSELCPQKRNYIFKVGYEAGGYTMNSNIYGYEFRSDPNVARLVASVVYVAMRSILKPDTDTMRSEVGGRKYDKTLYELWDVEPRNHVTDDAFYIDLRKFMASAPAPYAPAYKDRSRNNPTFPDAKTENGCLQMDMDIHNFIVSSENLPKQTTVQAIADKDWDTNHFFGSGKKDVHGYEFNAVFGEKTIGEYITPNSKLADFINLIKQIGGSARGILQHADPSLGAIEYGRLRPACSWEQECKKHSETDNRWNASTDWFIEDGDGNPTGYYDANGNWTQPDKVDSPEDFEEIQRTELYANSYPSGHSSGSWCGGMSLTEIYPYKADLILREMVLFSTNRSITRFHWMSDVIQGRVVGSAMNAVCHAAKDYDELLKNVKM